MRGLSYDSPKWQERAPEFGQVFSEALGFLGVSDEEAATQYGLTMQGRTQLDTIRLWKKGVEIPNTYAASLLDHLLGRVEKALRSHGPGV